MFCKYKQSNIDLVHQDEAYGCASLRQQRESCAHQAKGDIVRLNLEGHMTKRSDEQG